jgi:hsp70-interacting protein
MAKPRALSKRPGCERHYLLAIVLSVAFVLPLLMPAATAAAAVAVADGENKSALGGTTHWATGKDGEELVAEREAGRVDSLVEDEFAGGFGSLDSMLQWAIGTGSQNPKPQNSQETPTFL